MNKQDKLLQNILIQHKYTGNIRTDEAITQIKELFGASMQ